MDKVFVLLDPDGVKIAESGKVQGIPLVNVPLNEE